MKTVRLSFFQKMKLQYKLIAAFVFIILITSTASGGAGSYFLNKVQEAFGIVSDITGPFIVTGTEITTDIEKSHLIASKLNTIENMGQLLENEKELFHLNDKLDAKLNQFDSLARGAGVYLDTASLKKAQNTFIESVQKILFTKKTLLSLELTKKLQLAKAEKNRKEIDRSIGKFITHNLAVMSGIKNQEKTLVSSGKATIKNLDKLLSETLTEHFPVINELFLLQRTIIELKEIIVFHTNPNVTMDEIEIFPQKTNKQLKKSYTWLKALNKRKLAENDQRLLKDIEEHLFLLEGIILNPGGLFETQKNMLQIQVDKEKLQAELILNAKNSRDKLNSLINNAVNLGRKKQQNTKNEVINWGTQGKALTIIITILSLVIALLIGISMARSIARPLTKMVNTAKEISEGNLECRINVTGNDEVGKLGQAFQAMIISLREMSAIEKRIAEGDVNVDFEPRSESDAIGNAMKTMVESLKEMAAVAGRIAEGDLSVDFKPKSEHDFMGNALFEMTQKIRLAAAENERRNWFKSGQAELSNVMRGNQNIQDLTRNMIGYLVPYMNAQVGAVYLLNKEKKLRLTGSYAYTKRKNLSNEFKLGEGLVGQAALEKQPICLSNVPDDYVKINSGLGETSPKNILVFPLLLDDTAIGVLEIGSLYEFTDVQTEFLGLVAENIAMTIRSCMANMRTVELLAETQSQARELQTQQEELKTTNEELEKHSNILQKQKEAIEQKNSELQQARKIIEKKAKELEVASQYKSDFLANMSHELRTPLNSLLILSQTLAENKKGNLTAKQIEYAQTIHSSGSDLLELINDILDLSKVEAGKMELDPRNVRLTDFSDYIKRNLMPLIEKKGLSFEIKIAPGLPVRINTDYQRVNQIMKNLIANAVKFTHKGGVRVEIFRPGKDIDLSGSGLDVKKTVAFAVSDTGIGIPQNKKKLIFEAFQQVDGSTSKKYGGTGLGLSFSKELASLLGGEIQLESEEGKGSTFTLYLPENLSQKQASPKSIFEPSSLEKITGTDKDTATLPIRNPSISQEFVSDDRKIIEHGDKVLLIIEDDQSSAKIILDIAREKDFKCLVAEDGETGLYFADYYKPGAIILDITLPGISGWTVMERLKENPETRNIPVHFMSASDKNIAAMKMGAVGFLTKPVSLEVIDEAFKKIEDIISRKIKTLLIVLDNNQHKKSVLNLLEGMEIKTTLASTGQEAYDLLKRKRFDSIILDPCLIDGSGFDLLEKIKYNEIISYIPIIIFSSKKLNEEEENKLRKYTESVTIKKVKSPEILLDEVVLFLHLVEKNLPAKQQKIIKKTHDQDTVLTNKTILLIDDDVRNVFALSNILREKGVKVLAEKNGQDGLECLNKNPDIDLVLMDIMMPEMDGYEATREIRKQKRFENLPIIAITAKAMKGDKNECLKAGANDYIAKPFDKDRLLSVLKVWLYKAAGR